MLEDCETFLKIRERHRSDNEHHPEPHPREGQGGGLTLPLGPVLSSSDSGGFFLAKHGHGVLDHPHVLRHKASTGAPGGLQAGRLCKDQVFR